MLAALSGFFEVLPYSRSLAWVGATLRRFPLHGVYHDKQSCRGAPTAIRVQVASDFRQGAIVYLQAFHR